MRKLLYTLIVLLALGNITKAQTDFTIGTGTTGNAPNSTGAAGYPCPLQDYYESHRAQYLWQASELITAGMTPGFITALKWDVVTLGTAGLIEQFQVKIGATSVSSLTSNSWETVNTVVFAMADYQPVAGINTFTLSTPFYWNGVDNIIIEVCNGEPGNATGNWFTASPVIAWTTGLSFNASHNYRIDNAGNACGATATANTGSQTSRPNIIFTQMPAPACSSAPVAGVTNTTATFICPGSPFNLWLTGTTEVSALDYQWQTSPDGNAPWTNIPGATSYAIFGHTQPTSYYYRAAVTCGANTDYSTPVLVTSPAILNGTYTINNAQATGGTNFQSFADANAALQCGIGGPVLFNVSAGQVFVETTNLNFTGTGSATNTITFKKNGAGTNPIIRRSGTSATTDYVVRLTGVNYYTFDGIDFEQTGTAAADYVEFGVHVINSSAVSGSSNNTFKNGKVKLGAYPSTKGVYVQASPTPTDFSGTNNNNRFLNMTIDGGIYGYHITGGTSTYKADGNEVGTESGGTSMIQNIGSGTASSTLYGLLAEYQTNFKVRNTIVNSVAGTETSTVYGVTMQASATNTGEISGNTIYGISGGGTVYALYVSAGEAVSVMNNQVYNITSTGNASSIRGIYVTATGITANIIGNNVYNISSTGTTTTSVSGIDVATGLEFNVFNNIVNRIIASASTQTGAGTRGISVSGGSTGGIVRLYHNTVYLNDAGTVAAYTSAALHNSSVIPTLDLRNNIFVNNTDVTTGNRAVAFWKTSATDNIDNASNNNLYYAGTPGPKNLVYYNGTASVETLAEYKTLAAVSPGETASISVLPPFINIAAAPYNLHINTTIATEVESGGMPLTEVTTDIDGDTRNAGTPDIGADEFAGIGADFTGPSITYTDLPVKTICTTPATIVATITDGSGVNSTAGTKPRLWFKKASETDALPATNTSASNGWKWVEATNAISPFEFTFDFSLLTAPLAAGDSISYFIVSQDVVTPANVSASTATFNATPTSVALSAGSFPVTGNINGFSVISQPNPITISISSTELCASGTVTLDVDNIDVIGGEYQWQSSPAGLNTWSDISGATTVPYTTGQITASTDFRLVLKCGGTPIASSPSSVVTLTVNNPQVASTTGASRCGPGTLTLTASAPGYNVNWYESATGGLSLYNGDVFTTPALTNTTTYYVGASVGGGGTISAGMPNAISTSGYTLEAGLFFDALADFTLEGVNVYPIGTGAGTVTIALQTTGNVTLQSIVVNLTGTAAPYVKTYVPLNFTIPAGTDYRLVMLSRAGSVSSLVRESGGSWGSYPLTVPGVMSITNGKCCPDAVSTSYYYFYDWQISAGCEGTRVPVIATINTPPLIDAEASSTAICQGQSTTLSVTSTNTGYTYTWTPGGMTGSSVVVNPTETTKYYVTAIDGSAGTFNGCANIDSITIDVSQIPSPVNITPPTAAICLGGNAEALTVNGGTLAFNAVIGTGVVQNATNSTTNIPPYGNYYSGNRHQMLVLASELAAEGLTGGSVINSLAFDVVSNTNALGYNNFTIKLGHTTESALSTTFLSTATTEVYTSPNFSPTVGWSTHDFSAPFIWDGTSNLLVETYFTNCGNTTSSCTGGTTCTGAGSGVTWTQSAVTNLSNTSFVSHAFYYSDGESCNPQTVSTASTAVSVRPNMQFGYGAPTTITWAPATGLYTDAAATMAYVGGTHATTVYAKPAAATTYTITATAGAGCSSTGTVNVAVTTPPAATISYSGSPYCNSGTAAVSLTGTTGGTFTSTSGLIIDATTGEIDLVTSLPGTYTVTYTISAAGGCGVFTTTSPITINAAPTATISYTGSPYCTGSGIAMVTLSGAAGGTYSSTTGLSIDPVTGNIDVAASTLGTYTVTYTIAASGGCPVYTTTATVIITDSPAATISYAGAPYCTNAGVATVTRTGTAGGTYSSTTGLSIDAVTGDINLGASTAGTYTVTYAISSAGGCSAFSTTTSITIAAAPSSTISYTASPYCAGSGIASVVHTGTTGGTYSVFPSGLSINSTSGTIDLALSAPGTYTVTYTIQPANGCVVYTTTTSVTISPKPAAIINYAGSPFCNTGATVNVTLTGTSGGTYSSTTGLAIDANTGAINVGASTVGNYLVTYTIPAGNGCAEFSTTTNVVIVPPSAATISYTGSPYCTNGGTANVTHTGTTGGTYTSTTGLSINATSGAINLGLSTPGTYVVTYTMGAVTGCPAFTTSASVTITGAPSAQITYAGSPFCSNGTIAGVTRVGTSGGLYSSTTGLDINASSGLINIANSTPGTYTVSYTLVGSNGCSNFVATTQVVITEAPSATISYAGSPFCSNAGTANVTQTGSAGGTYSSTNGLVIDGTTGAIDLGASTAGTYVVSYSFSGGGCPAYSATTAVTIAASPSATISYAGSPYCSTGSTANVTRTGTPGGTYSSTTGLTINPTTGAINIASSTPGTYTVTYTINAVGPCPSFNTTTDVTITTPPSATISYAGSPYCSSVGVIAVTQTGTTGGTYTSTPGLSINNNTGAIDAAASNGGTYTVTYTINAAGGCGTYSTTTSVTITTAPSAIINYAGSPYCGSTGLAVVTQSGSSGGTYSSSTGLAINPTTGVINLATSTPGTYTVNYTIAAANGCATYTATATVQLTTPGTWTGLAGTDWNNASNWCGGIPSSATDAFVPAAATNMPNLSNGAGAARNITLEQGVVLTIGTAGSLELHGNITGGGSLNASNGSITLRGITDQVMPAFTVTNLTMNMVGPGTLNLTGNSAVTGTLLLSNGNITLGSNSLSLTNGANGKLTSHIITNGTGNVLVPNLAASQNRTIPVGSDAVSYNPIALISNAGHVSDNFTVRVQQGVYENGTSGITFQTHVADRMWIVNEAVPGGSNLNITLQWNGSQELSAFSRAKSYVTQYIGTAWEVGTPTTSLGGDPYTQTKTGVTTLGSFAVQTQPIPRPTTGIYPNPASDHLNVVTDLLSTGPVVFSVYDDHGKLVYRKHESLTVGVNQTRLDIAHLSAGVYILKVTTRLNEQFMVQRFVKTN